MNAPQLGLLEKKALQTGLKSGRYKITKLGVEQKCSTCNEYWPLDSDFFFRASYSPTGLQRMCKACIIERKRKHTR